MDSVLYRFRPIIEDTKGWQKLRWTVQAGNGPVMPFTEPVPIKEKDKNENEQEDK